MTDLLKGLGGVSDVGVMGGAGEDGGVFLHSQLTQDFSSLDMRQARLAAFLSAKGRMQASFIGLRRPDEWLLLCSRDLLPATLARLSMFVLRAKARLTDASADFALYGLAGDTLAAVSGGAPTAWSKGDNGPASPGHLYPPAKPTLVPLSPAATQPRARWVAPAGDPPPAGPALATALWLWSEVASGVATLSSPVAQVFVPQMLNYESVGGVSFKKGCYPGQEVVARSQFRGTLKRRAYIAHAEADIAVGAEVFAATDLTQPCGTVVQAAAAPGGGVDAIVSLQIAAAHQALQVGAETAQPLTLAPLPYPLLQDI